MVPVHTLDDPRLAPYRNLRDRTLRGERMFVAEGRLLVERLLASRFEVESLLVAEPLAAEYAQRVPERVPVYVAPASLLQSIIGFHLHQGVLAVGKRQTEMSLDEMFGGADCQSAGLDTSATCATSPLGIVVCPAITKPENMGLVFRVAAGLGVDGLLLGPQCCDPFSRRCLRVSMGAVFTAPYRKSPDLTTDLALLRDRWGVEILAAVLDERAVPLPSVCWPGRAAVMLGNEFEGLDDRWLAYCSQRVTIPMARQTDSLNLGVAAGIFVYEMMSRRSGDHKISMR
jgi:tRNA G18 (ribose-2'-O)-methylase SpoU